MKVHTLKKIMIDRLGTVPPGRDVELHDSVARHYLDRGAVELYETKVLRERPYVAPGAVHMLSASPVGQALPQTNASASDGGKPKRKYTKRAKSSS